MTYTLLKIVVTAISLAAAVRLIEGIEFTGRWWMMLLIAVIFGLVNALIKPIVKLFTLPFLVLTLGLFTLVINALMLELTAYLSELFRLGLRVEGFWAAFKGGLVISVVSMLLHCVAGLTRQDDYRR